MKAFRVKNWTIVLVSIFLTIAIAWAMIFLLNYPTKYKQEIEFFANKYNLSPSLVASVIKIESNYDEKSISNAGAVGLMQILPSTALDMSNRMGIDLDTNNLCDVNTNIDIGCFYLRYLLDMFDGNISNTLSAYNWGLANVKTWMLRGNIDGYGSIKDIPVKETANYLKKYKKAKFVYCNIFGYDV